MTISRRKFLQGLGALGAAAVVSPKVLIDEGAGYEVEPVQEPEFCMIPGENTVSFTESKDVFKQVLRVNGEAQPVEVGDSPFVDLEGQEPIVQIGRPSLYSQLCELHNSQAITTEQIQKRIDEIRSKT